MITPVYSVAQLVAYGQPEIFTSPVIATYDNFSAAYEFAKFKTQTALPQHLIDKDGTVAYVVFSSLSPKYTIKGIKNDEQGRGTYITEELTRVPAEIADAFITWFANEYPYAPDKTDEQPLRYIKILEV